MLKHLERKKLHPDIINKFHNLISICLHQNVCIFKKKSYKFPGGVPMGGPLSALVADIFKDELETFFVESSSYARATHIRFWARYVDDVLCIWMGPHSVLQDFLQALNNYDPSLKFTLEMGGERINFLDLIISLMEQQNILRASFQVYRKVNFSGVSIHADSYHPKCS